MASPSAHTVYGLVLIQDQRMSLLKYNTAAQANAQRLADAYLPKPSPIAATPTPKVQSKMSKLNELAAALADVPKQVEAEADKALTRLTAAKTAAFTGIDKIHTISETIEQSTKDIENFTNQLTNGGPPLSG